MDTQLRALADGTRRQIVAMVWHEECSAGEIAAEFAMSRPAVSQHLKVLVRSDLLAVRRIGTRRLYRANCRAVTAVVAELARFWGDRLSALKAAAEAVQRRKR
jgi:DNA-binding transcriptional ArsR family regulator